MTSPDRFSTDKTYSPSTIHRLQEQSKEAAALEAHAGTKARMDSAGGSFVGIILGGFANVAMAIGKALSDLAEALFGNYTGSNASLVVISDGMTGIVNRIDVMEKVSGYGGMFMTKNYRYGSGSEFRKIKFDGEYGPPKNTIVDTANNRIYLAQGTWSVSLHVATGPGSGGTTSRGRIDVYYPDGTLLSRRSLDWASSGSGTTAFHQVPVVTTEPGCYVEAWYTHTGLWWTVLGGTERTLMFVNRWDIDTDNAVSMPEVPDGGDVT